MLIREFGDTGNKTAVRLPDNTVFIGGSLHVVWVGEMDGERRITVAEAFDVTPAAGGGYWIVRKEAKANDA